MLRTEPLRKAENDIVIGAALPRRLDQLGPEQDVLLAHVALVRPLDQGDVEQARKKS